MKMKVLESSGNSKSGGAMHRVPSVGCWYLSRMSLIVRVVWNMYKLNMGMRRGCFHLDFMLHINVFFS